MRKVCVYAIAKNEAKFVERFMDSASEADYVVVLDTGSTDNTVQRLRARGATVEARVIEPWRFDVARNESMKLIPPDTDICVCFDLDEYLTPGWRELVEAAWTESAEQANYRYVWNYNPDGSEGTTFTREKIHAPGIFEWRNPVHEVLCKKDGTPPDTIYIDGFTCCHKADETKSRGSYLPLLELAVEENAENDRNMHYLGREYMFYGRWQEAIDTLKRHLALKSATWDAERCASMRFIGRCYKALGDSDEAMRWFMRACAEAPQLREPWYEAEKCAYDLGEWDAVIFYGERARTYCHRQDGSYIQDAEAWGCGVDDMLCIAYWNTGHPDAALMAAEAAYEMNPKDERLRNNVIFLSEYTAAEGVPAHG